jgi:hypothetical protein
MKTICGNHFEYDDVSKIQIAIFDIAASLANQCRFLGHLEHGKFYSVAEHCCHAHDLAPMSCQIQALMHDSPEAYTGDLMPTMKDMFPGLRTLDTVIHIHIGKTLGFDPMHEHDRIKDIDRYLFISERAQLKPRTFDMRDVDKKHLHPIHCWSPHFARDQFLSRYQRWLDRRRITQWEPSTLSTTQFGAHSPG